MSVTKIIRMEEVKKNNNSSSSWLVIHNSVYDVTYYLNEHPGGVDVLLERAGKDASEAFKDVGHSSDAHEMMVQYKIGELHKDDIVKTDAKNSNSSDKGYKWNFWLMNGVVLCLIFTTGAVAVYNFGVLK